MANFISIPTQVVGQKNIIFNSDNITAVVPPTSGDTTAAGLYFSVWTQSKVFRLTLGGSTATIQNTNAIAASNIVSNAVIGGNPSPICSFVDFSPVLLKAGSGATGQTTITVASTAGLSAGMVVTVVSGQGVFATNTTISSITNGTQFVVSAAPTTALAGAEISAAALTVTAIAVA